jgi:hypothetical protein
VAVRCIVCGAGWPCEIAVGGLVAAASCGAAADWASAKLSRYEDAALGAEKVAALGHAIAGERRAVANGAADERFACEVAARCALDELRGDGMERAGGGTIEVEEMGGLASTASPVRHPRTARGLAAIPAGRRERRRRLLMRPRGPAHAGAKDPRGGRMQHSKKISRT